MLRRSAAVFPNRLLKRPWRCHSERSEESAFRKIPRKKRIPRAQNALGMTSGGIFQQPARALRAWSEVYGGIQLHFVSANSRSSAGTWHSLHFTNSGCSPFDQGSYVSAN